MQFFVYLLTSTPNGSYIMRSPFGTWNYRSTDWLLVMRFISCITGFMDQSSSGQDFCNLWKSVWYKDLSNLSFCLIFLINNGLIHNKWSLQVCFPGFSLLFFVSGLCFRFDRRSLLLYFVFMEVQSRNQEALNKLVVLLYLWTF